MSYIAFFSTTAATTPIPYYGLKFNDSDTGAPGGKDRNSMYLPTMAAWPLAPLVIAKV